MSEEGRTVPLASDGYPMIGGAVAVAALAGVGWLATGGVAAGIFAAIALVALVAVGFLLNFFRDPERTPPENPAALVSPADGRILIAEPVVDENRFLHQAATKISIFMSPLDVHVNRAPVTGEVVDVRYNPGKYLAAFSEKASLDNEQNAIVMRAEDGRKLVFIQIAGLVARRIVCRVSPGDRKRKGERVGMIKLGSRVDVFVPGEFSLRVKVGDRVTAGVTVLGELR